MIRAPTRAHYLPVASCAWRRARSRDSPPQQRVNQARFADIRAPDHGHFRQIVSRKAHAPAALVMNSAEIFKGWRGWQGPDRQERSTSRDHPAYPAFPASSRPLMSNGAVSMSNGVVDDGAVDRFGLSARAQTARQ